MDGLPDANKHLVEVQALKIIFVATDEYQNIIPNTFGETIWETQALAVVSCVKMVPPVTDWNGCDRLGMCIGQIDLSKISIPQNSLTYVAGWRTPKAT